MSVYTICVGGTWHLTQAILVRFLFSPAQTRRLSPLMVSVGTLIPLVTSTPIKHNPLLIGSSSKEGEKRGTEEAR